MYRQELLIKLEQINDAIKTNYKTEKDIGVLSGTAGMAIFQFYYSRLTNNSDSADFGVEILSSIIEEINNGYSLPTYCAGISGAGWAMELLNEEDFVELDCDAMLSTLDDFLVEAMQIDTHENFYDFLHGVLGIGYYFLKRYQNTTNTLLKEKYGTILFDIVDRLTETAIIQDDCAKWECYLIRTEGIRGYNLGLAHGISSIINFLSRLYSLTDFQPKVNKLLKQSVNYILSFQSRGLAPSSIFPDWITLDDKMRESGRLAWCYGDLGVSLSLWQAGKTLADNSITEKALHILKNTTKRTNLEDTRVFDAGLCHGAAGIAQIYNRLHQETSEKVFDRASGFWMDKTLALATHKDGYAGYKQKRGDGQTSWSAELSLLEGVAGIGLSIIAHLEPTQSKWDQCLLIG